MNLLHANDRRGAYPPSWYAATAEAPPPRAPLKGAARADICVVGAGYTGLSAALHLAEAGLDVVLLEAQRVGFGASGRNGGQLGSGQRMEQVALERLVGADDAAHLWRLGEEAKDLVKGLVARHAIDCHLKPGVAHACFTPREMAGEHAYADHLAARYGYGEIETLDRDAFAALCPSPAYHGGTLDMGAAHLHPLSYALGLARAAEAAGVRIYERSEVHDIRRGARLRVATDAGHVEADHLILACNGYLGGLERRVAARVMPINNFIVATEPLGEDAARVLTRDVAVADTKFVVNYFRLSHDKRLLFGGGESYGYRFPRDIRATVRRPMLEIFPHLADVRLDYAWGGTLAITMRRMPYLAQVAPNILSASGYSGHGLGMATLAGRLMAEAVRGRSEGFECMARVPCPAFPGGAALRNPLLVLAMSWFALRDRLGF
jgi:gamma-glutamylputrescine oxidase